jgi:hypothetical protein
MKQKITTHEKARRERQRRESIAAAEYITAREAAQRYGRTEEALQLDRTRKIGWPYYRDGRKIRYKPAEIEARLQASRVDPAT